MVYYIPQNEINHLIVKLEENVMKKIKFLILRTYCYNRQCTQQ